MELDNSALAEKLTKRAQVCVKVVKIFFIAILVVAVALILFAIIITATGFIKENRTGALIGFVVFEVAIILLLAGVVASFLTAKLCLNKLKKLN
ncbi:MAG: hypothetical protein K2G96_01175 [Clostridia bacterium]|nr:hypothetical protein [Clostridia bacterium]